MKYLNKIYWWCQSSKIKRYYRPYHNGPHHDGPHHKEGEPVGKGIRGFFTFCEPCYPKKV